MLDSSGAIRNTTLQKHLSLKVGAKVMLTYNVDTIDSLTNGTFGEVLDFQFGKKNTVSKIVVHFFDENCGKLRRKDNSKLCEQYPGSNATAIERIEFPYNFSKKANCSAKNTKVIQFPLRLAFAATSHKVQGKTVLRPSSLAVDLLSVREAAQGYVMLSRVESHPQLFILDVLTVDKIFASPRAMEENERLEEVFLKELNNY